MKYNLSRNAKWVVGLVPAAYSAAATTGTPIDTTGYNFATAFVYAGAAAANAEAQVTILEGATLTTCTAHVAGSTFTQITPTAATNGFQLIEIDLRKRNKYINFKNVGDGSNAVTLGMGVLLHNANVAPFAQASVTTVKTAI